MYHFFKNGGLSHSLRQRLKKINLAIVAVVIEITMPILLAELA